MAKPREASDAQRVRTYLRKNGGKATVRELCDNCSDNYQAGWSKQRLHAAIDWDNAHRSNRAHLQRERGGRSIRIVENDERVAHGRGAKAEVVRRIAGQSARVRHIFGKGDDSADWLEVAETGKSAAPERGSNARPDITVGSYLRPTSRRPLIHNIEFQGESRGRNTFSSSDIAQAYTSGRGADFSWVMIHKSARLTKSHKRYVDWERAIWFAKTLGVGIILYDSPQNVATWNTVMPAKKRGGVNYSGFRSNYLAWYRNLRPS